MLSNCTNNLLNLEDIFIKKIIQADNYVKVFIETKQFKGNTDAGKYQCILVDAKKNRILDILPGRSQSHLIS